MHIVHDTTGLMRVCASAIHPPKTKKTGAKKMPFLV